MTYRAYFTIFVLFLIPHIINANPLKDEQWMWHKSPNPIMDWQVHYRLDQAQYRLIIDIEETMIQEKYTAVALFNRMDAFFSRNISPKNYVIDFDELLKMLLVFTNAQPKNVDPYVTISTIDQEWNHLEYGNDKNPSKSLEDILLEQTDYFTANNSGLNIEPFPIKQILFTAPSYEAIATDHSRLAALNNQIWQKNLKVYIMIQGINCWTF